jgi:RecA-family ATPase
VGKIIVLGSEEDQRLRAAEPDQHYVPPGDPDPVGGTHQRCNAAEDKGEEQKPPEPPKLDFVSPADWEGKPVPARRWLVPEFIPAGEITMFSGDGGTGKSLLALQLAIATAAGKEWIGTAPEPGKALFISAEDDEAELHRRTANIVRALKIRFSDLADLTLLSLAGKDAILAAPEKRDGPLVSTPLFTAIKAAVERYKPSLLCLDTLADLFGGNEILRPHARQFIGLLRGLALGNDLTIVLLSHPSQSGMASGSGTSGSTAWNNSVRSRLYLDRAKSGGEDDDHDARVLTTKKSNYGRTGAERVLRWVDGVFVAEGMGGGQEAQRRADAERVFLDLLAEFERQGRDVSPSFSRSYAPKVFAAAPAAKGFSKELLATAMERLFTANRIHVATSGPPSKQRQRVASGPPPIHLTERRDEI